MSTMISRQNPVARIRKREHFPPPLRGTPSVTDHSIPSHEEQRRQQQQQVGRAKRKPQAAADRRQVVDHQVGAQGHESSVVAVVPDVGEQIDRHCGDPWKEPPLLPQAPCGEGQQQGIHQPVDLRIQIIAPMEFPHGIHGREREEECGGKGEIDCDSIPLFRCSGYRYGGFGR